MFIKNEPALVIGRSRNRYIVVADLHIGITRELFMKGIRIPRQSLKFSEKLNMLGKKVRARKIVIAGDLKHKVPGTSYQEMKEVPAFLEALDFEKIIIVKGNHDGRVEEIITDSIDAEIRKKIEIRNEYECCRWLITHGHRKIDSLGCEKIISAHIHPYVMMQDKMNAVYSEPVWLKGRLISGNEIIVMPAFNELCGASVINSNEFIGPVAKKIDTNETNIYLLDGTDIGSLKSFGEVGERSRVKKLGRKNSKNIRKVKLKR